MKNLDLFWILFGWTVAGGAITLVAGFAVTFVEWAEKRWLK